MTEPPDWCKKLRRCEVRCDNCPENEMENDRLAKLEAQIEWIFIAHAKGRIAFTKQ